MECFTRADDYFGEVERFIRMHRRNGNIKDKDSRQSIAQATCIKGCHQDLECFWNNDYNFARTAGAVMRTLILAATKIAINTVSEVKRKQFVSMSSMRNDDLLEFVDDDKGGMPCPANIHAKFEQAMEINGRYACQFEPRGMKDVRMRNMQYNETRFITEVMIVVKPGKDQIEFWYIISTLRVCKRPDKETTIMRYDAVPTVAVIYMIGNKKARDKWRIHDQSDTET